jgi:hypothetical protein
MRQLVKATLICTGFVVLGVYALLENAPIFVAWGTIVIFGGLATLGLVAMAYQAITGKPWSAATANVERIALRDGRDYTVHVTEDEIVLSNRTSNETRHLPWSGLTSIYVVAIDGHPIGGISFMLHADKEIVEVPTDSGGGEYLLSEMQRRLAGFDNAALVEAMGMLHGFKCVWTKT